MSQNHTLITLPDLFKDRSFIVPDYQRGYSWENEHREDLLNDIVRICKRGSIHYTGAIVAVKRQDSENLYEIVDGQQRLTSLLLLLKAILDTNKKLKHEKQDLENLFFYDSSKDNRFKFQLNKEDNDYFKNYMINVTQREPRNKSEQNIKDAHVQFENFFINRDCDEFLDAMLIKLGFILYTPDSNTEVGAMFEVINNRGKKLSELEKIKNYLIYYSVNVNAPLLRDILNEEWSNILENLTKAKVESNNEEDEFLRYIWWTLEEYNKRKDYEFYVQIKSKWNVDEKDNVIRQKCIAEIRNFVKILAEFSLYYRNLFSDEEKDDPKIEKCLERIKYHPLHSPIIPLYFAVSSRMFYEYKEEYIQILEILEKLNFRVYVVPSNKRSDSGQADLYKIANNFYKNKNFSFDELSKQLIVFIDKNCNFRKFVESLTLDIDEDYDYSHWQGLRYFLINYEEAINPKKIIKYNRIVQPRTKGKSESYYDIEHIWAIKNSEDKKTGSDKHQKCRLGNLVLLESGKNKSLKDKPIDVKQVRYKEEQSELKMVQELPKIIMESIKFIEEEKNRKNKTNKYWLDLSKRINDSREQNLIEFAIKRWGIDPQQVDISVKIDSFSAEEQKKNEIFTIESLDNRTD